MKIEFDGSYPYDTDTVMEWWIGSERFFEDIANAFVDQVDVFLTQPEQLRSEIREAISVLLDRYEDTFKGSAFDAYHEHQLALHEESLFG